MSIDDEEHRNKKHTEYWFNFWNENKNKSYDIRINPEFSLYYTLANEKLKDKKGK
ncbi:MAG: hypothetical protein LBC61_05515 [Candidatus Peribacteria bacterium]|nr:hypothetical protein [Candidatus Peribacteria bacterium]